MSETSSTPDLAAMVAQLRAVASDVSFAIWRATVGSGATEAAHGRPDAERATHPMHKPLAFGQPGWAPDPAVLAEPFGLQAHVFVGRLDRPCDRCGLPDRASCHLTSSETVAAEPLPTLPPSHVGAMLRGLRADLRALAPEVEFTVEREVGGAMGECVVVRWRSPAPDDDALPQRNTLRVALWQQVTDPDDLQRRGIVERVRKGLARYGAMRETLTVERPAFDPLDAVNLRSIAGVNQVAGRVVTADCLRRIAARIERATTGGAA